MTITSGIRRSQILAILLLVSSWTLCPATENIDALRERAAQHAQKGDIAAALAAYEALWALPESELTENRSKLAAASYREAVLLARAGRADDASIAYRRAIDLLEFPGQALSDTAAIVRINFARYLLERQRFSEARKALDPLTKEAEDPASLSVSPKHRASARTTLGEIQTQSLQWDDALETLEAAIADCVEAHGEIASATALAYNNLGRLLNKFGASERAEIQFRHALDIYAGLEAPEPLNRIRVMVNLGAALIAQRQFRRAAITLAFAYNEAKRHDVPDAHVASVRNQFARVCFEQGLFAQAVDRFNEALQSAARAGGEINPSKLAVAHNSLGIARILTGDFEGASENIQKAGDLLASVPSQLDLLETRFSVYFNRAMLLHHVGKRSESLEVARGAVARLKTSLEVFAFLPPGARLAYSQRLIRYPFHLAGTLADPEFAFETASAFKGLLSESLAKDRRLFALSGEGVEKLAKLERDYATATLRNDKETAEDLRKRIRKARRDLVNETPDASPSTAPDIHRIRNALATGELVIDFFEFRNNRGADGWTWDVGALVLRRDRAPAFYSIPSEDVGRLRDKLASLKNRIDRLSSLRSGAPADAESPRDWCEEVFEIVMGPVAGALSECTDITLCTDGILHSVPFSILWPKGKDALVSTHRLRHVKSLRDLVVSVPRLVDTRPKPKALLVGDPEFDHRIQTTSIDPGSRKPRGPKITVGSNAVSRLSGSAREIALLEDLLAPRFEVLSLQRKQPDEPAVRRAIAGSTIVHFATHGFYDDPSSATRGFVGHIGTDDPMFRSGLTLVGATQTRQAWGEGNIPDAASDGILLASEIAGLDMASAHLVVLSACDTARGKPLGGQGVQGIRQALGESGCSHVVTTLWTIDDWNTVPLMRVFYEECLAGARPHVAMGTAQRSILGKDGATKSWRTLLDAGPFIVTSLGRLD